MVKTRRGKNAMNEILAAPDKRVNETYGVNGLLAGLFRKFLEALDIRISRWETLMTDFLNDARNNIPQTQKKRVEARGNLHKEFSKEQITWRVFCKAMRFLQFTRIEFRVTAYNRHGNSITRQVDLELGDRADSSFWLEDEPPETEISKTDSQEQEGSQE